MTFVVGDIIHGFAGGAFGRDSYECRRVEHVGPDYIVTRSDEGVELCRSWRWPTREEASDRSDCGLDCNGPELDGRDA